MAFVLVLSALLGLVHLYLWRRLVHDTHLRGALRAAASVTLALLAVSVPITFAMWMIFSRDVGAWFPLFAFSWLGSMFYLLLALGAWDTLRALRWLTRKLVPGSRSAAQNLGPVPPVEAASFSPPVGNVSVLEPQSRRVFIARSAAASALVAAGGISALGVRSAVFEITTPQLAIGLQRFPRALDGYKIALLSDVHIGPTLDGRFLRAVVEQTNALRPDLVAIVGDLVDGSVSEIGAQVAELHRLRARHGVHFVTGNHEYYSQADEWIAFLPKLGIRVLLNQRVRVGDANNARFDLAGIADPHASRAYGPSGRHDAPDAALATRGRDHDHELVMLAHQPILIEQSAAVGAGLQLSGHTHGGQLYPFGAVTRLVQPYLAGLHSHPGSPTQIYVSRGTGFWGPPMRVLAPAEISQLRLHST